MLELSKQKVEGVLLVRIGGKLDVTNYQQLLDVLMAEVDSGERLALLDCTRLEYISSSGLRAVFSADQRLNAVGGKLALSALTEQIRKIFDMAGFMAMLTTYPSAKEGIEALQSR